MVVEVVSIFAVHTFLGYFRGSTATTEAPWKTNNLNLNMRSALEDDGRLMPGLSFFSSCLWEIHVDLVSREGNNQLIFEVVK